MNLAANGADPSGDLLFVNFNQDKTYVYHEVFFDMYVCIWLNCMRLRSSFLQLKRQCKSMSRQHLGVTTQFPSQGMGWFGRRFIHLPSESWMRIVSGNRNHLCSNRSPWPLHHGACFFITISPTFLLPSMINDCVVVKEIFALDCQGMSFWRSGND